MLKGHYVVLEKKILTHSFDIDIIDEVMKQTQKHLFLSELNKQAVLGGK